jgi:hypothetical protein
MMITSIFCSNDSVFIYYTFKPKEIVVKKWDSEKRSVADVDEDEADRYRISILIVVTDNFRFF